MGIRLVAVHAVLKETLRLFTSAPLVARTSIDEPLVIPSTSKLYLPPKTQIMMSSLLAHKRQDLWGPDAEAFRPERWFDPALLDKVTRTPFMYSPFYGGPRAVSPRPSQLEWCFEPITVRSVSDRNSRLTKRASLLFASSNDSRHSASRRSLCPRVRCRLRTGLACLAAKASRRSSRRSTSRCTARCAAFFFLFGCFATHD